MAELLLTDEEITAIVESTAAPLVSAIALHNLLPEARAIAQAQLAKAQRGLLVVSKVEPSDGETRAEIYRGVGEWLSEHIISVKTDLPQPFSRAFIKAFKRGEMPREERKQ